MDFEINKLAQPDLRTAGAKTLNRSPGDLLVTSDFTNNGGNLMLGLLMWIANANGAAMDYYFTNVLPCWGAPPTQDVLDGLDDNRIDPSDAITVSVDAQLDGGTAFTIVGKAADDSTVASGSTGINNDGSASSNALMPGIFTCTIVIAP